VFLLCAEQRFFLPETKHQGGRRKKLGRKKENYGFVLDFPTRIAFGVSLGRSKASGTLARCRGEGKKRVLGERKKKRLAGKKKSSS